MQNKISGLVDNVSEINNKACKTCIQRKNIKSEKISNQNVILLGLKIMD